MASVLTPRQRICLRVLVWLSLFVLANSLFLFLFFPEEAREFTRFYQYMLVSHVAGGVLLLVLATVFVCWHLQRVRKFLAPKAVSSGAGLTVSLYLLFGTGFFLIFYSNSDDNNAFFIAHRILGVLAPVCYGVHRLVSHYRPKAKNARIGLAAFAGFFVLMVAAQLLELPQAPEPPPAPVQVADPFIPFHPENYPSSSSPFFPSNTGTDSGGFFDSRLLTRGERGDFERIRSDIERYGFAADTTIGSETCARCHPDIVAQWKDSAHRFSSFNNPFYRAAVDMLRETVGREQSQWCAGCHDPAIMLAGNMTKDIDPLVPESQAGLTCLACHAIDEIHGVEGNANYRVADEKPSPYIADAASSGWRRELADLLIKMKPESHRRFMLKPFFRKSEFCLSCHKVSLDVPLNRYKYIRGQDEYDAWHDSGVSLNAARTFYLPDGPRNCQDCHMPGEDAPLGDVAAKDGKVKSHRFLSVNDALPFIRGDTKTLARIREFRKNSMRIDIFALERADGSWVRALDVSRPVLAPGEEVVFDVVVRNRGVGHTFPGGTNDSNQAWIDFRIVDESGKTLLRSGAVSEERRVDPSAHFYRVVFVRHDGTEAIHRDAWNFHVAAFARTIGPGTADVARYGFKVPKGLSGKKLRLEARLMWRKFNRNYTEFVFTRPGIIVPKIAALKGQTIPDLPITSIAESVVTLDVSASARAPRAIEDKDAWMRFNDHGIASLLQGAFDVAEASFAEVARLRPDKPDGFRNQARRWIQSANPDRALPLLRHVEKNWPTDPQRAYFWGRYFERIQDYEEAVRAYTGSLKTFSNDRDAWRHLGTVLFKLERYQESLQAYFEVLRIDPEDVEAHKRRVDIYKLLGKEEEAAAATRAFHKYRKDDQAQQLLRQFLQDHPEINADAQPRHIHR